MKLSVSDLKCIVAICCRFPTRMASVRLSGSDELDGTNVAPIIMSVADYNVL